MIKVYTSSVIEAPADAVWAHVRDFNGLARWTPFVVESRIEEGQPADRIGCVRNFRLRDGGVIRERLLTLSDYDYQCTYAILESPMGVENYVATLKLTPVTDGGMPERMAVEVAQHRPHALDRRVDDGRAANPDHRPATTFFRASKAAWKTPWPICSASARSRSGAQSNSALHSAKQRAPSVTGVSLSVAT